MKPPLVQIQVSSAFACYHVIFSFKDPASWVQSRGRNAFARSLTFKFINPHGFNFLIF